MRNTCRGGRRYRVTFTVSAADFVITPNESVAQTLIVWLPTVALPVFQGIVYGLTLLDRHALNWPST